MASPMTSRGPNALNMNTYMHGAEQEGEYISDMNPSTRPVVDEKAIEQQFDNFILEVQDYDKLLSDVHKNIDQITDGEGAFITDFYPQVITESLYDEDEEKKIVENTNPQLSKVIFSLERNNKTYKQQMKGWTFEFAKSSKLTQVLISENKILRSSITTKNKQLVILIQQIAKSQNQDIVELEQQLDQLKEQNGVLRDHLNKLNDQLENKRNERNKVQEVLTQVRSQYSNLQRLRVDAEDEEEHLSKTLELLEMGRLEQQKTQRKLQKQKDMLSKKKKDYQEEHDKILRQLDIYEADKDDIENKLVRNYKEQQTEKYRLIQEITDLGDAISKQKEDCRYFDESTLKNNNKNVQYEKLVVDYTKKIAQNSDRIKTIKKELQNTKKVETGLLSQTEMQKFDIVILKEQLQNLEEKQKKINEKWKKQLKATEQAHSRELSEWNNRLNKNQRQMAMKILQEKSQLSVKQKEMQKWDQKILDKKEELTELKSQMKEIKENQIRLTELKSKVKSLNK